MASHQVGRVHVEILRMEGSALLGARDPMLFRVGFDDAADCGSEQCSQVYRRSRQWLKPSAPPTLSIHEHFTLEMSTSSSRLQLACYRGGRFLGRVDIFLEHLPQREVVTKWYGLVGPKRECVDAQLSLSICYELDVDLDPTRGMRVYAGARSPRFLPIPTRIEYTAEYRWAPTGITQTACTAHEDAEEDLFPHGVELFCFPRSLAVAYDCPVASRRFGFLINTGSVSFHCMCLLEWTQQQSSYLPTARVAMSRSNIYDLLEQYLVSPAPTPVELPPRTWLEFPRLGYSIVELLEVVDLDLVLHAVVAILTEQSVVVRATQYSMLSHFAEVARALAWPFVHPLNYIYIPILPEQYSDVLLAPVPYFVGLHADQSVEGVASDAVLIDLDKNTSVSRTSAVLLPEADTCGLREAVRRLVFPRVSTNDRIPRAVAGEAEATDRSIRTEFLGYLSRLVGDYRSYLFFSADDSPIFIREQYLSTVAGPCIPFVSRLIRTQVWTNFLDQHVYYPAYLHDVLQAQTRPEGSGCLAPKLRPGCRVTRSVRLKCAQATYNLAESVLSASPRSALVRAISLGELLVVEEARTRFLLELRGVLAARTKVALPIDQFEALIFVCKTLLQHCFEASDFANAKQVLDVSPRFRGTDVTLRDELDEALVWRVPDFWAFVFAREMEQVDSDQAGAEVRESDTRHVASAVACALRELGVPVDVAQEVLEALESRDGGHAAVWHDVKSLMNSMYEAQTPCRLSLSMR